MALATSTPITRLMRLRLERNKTTNHKTPYASDVAECLILLGFVAVATELCHHAYYSILNRGNASENEDCLSHNVFSSNGNPNLIKEME